MSQSILGPVAEWDSAKSMLALPISNQGRGAEHMGPTAQGTALPENFETGVCCV